MPGKLSPELAARAVAAGLDIAARDFPADVEAAEAAAAAAACGLVLPDDRVAEPWPPMRVGYPA